MSFLFLFVIKALAASNSKIDFTQPSANLVDTYITNGGGGLPVFIHDIGDFMIKIAGVLAIILLIYSGIKRITSSGSSEAIGEADEIMWAALIGLMIAITSVLLLKTINPDLAILKPVDFTNLTIQPITATPTTVNVENSIALPQNGTGGPAPAVSSVAGTPGTVTNGATPQGGTTGTGGGVGNMGARVRTLAEIQSDSLIGEVTTFGGPKDSVGLTEIKPGDTVGLAYVTGRSDLPANFWRNDPNSRSLFQDLNPTGQNVFYGALYTDDPVPPGTMMTITNNNNGQQANFILIDRGPSRTGAVFDASDSLRTYMGFGSGNQNISIQRAPAGSVVGPVLKTPA